MGKMKIYKAIFRLDYPISYKVVDSLGSYLDFITQKLQKKPFKNFNNSIDFVLHALSSQAELEDGSICRFNISIKAIDVLVEYKSGMEIELLSKNAISEVFDEIVKKVTLDGFSNYDRIGIRLWLADDQNVKKFDQILGDLLTFNQSLNNVLQEKQFPPYDIGLILETKNSEGVNLRLNYGPEIVPFVVEKKVVAPLPRL